MRRSIALCLLGLFAIPFLAGCASFESGTWNVKIRNDTRRFVIVRDCKTSACHTFRYAKYLGPGTTVPAFDDGDGTSWWRVTDRRGKQLGCLTLGVSKRVDGYILAVSSLTGCS